jgi:hypothetical protein
VPRHSRANTRDLGVDGTSVADQEASKQHEIRHKYFETYQNVSCGYKRQGVVERLKTQVGTGPQEWRIRLAMSRRP